MEKKERFIGFLVDEDSTFDRAFGGCVWWGVS